MNVVSFPALVLAQDQTVNVVGNMDDLATATSQAFRNGYFDGVLILDSDGLATRIKGARKVRTIGSFWGLDLFLNPLVRVELQEAGPPTKTPLDNVKALIEQRLSNWDGADPNYVEEFRSKIRRAHTPARLIELVSLALKDAPLPE